MHHTINQPGQTNNISESTPRIQVKTPIL